MVDPRTVLLDPFTLRTVVSIVAGALTGLVVVRLTFFLHNQRDLFNALRAIRAELEYDRDQMAKLSRLLKDDMRRQHVDLPIEVPAGTTIEIRYVLSLPGALNVSAFDRLRQSGRLMAVTPATRQALFDLYDALDRINRLREHRETLHFNHVGNVHIVIDAADLDLDPGATANEEDLPPAVRERLEDLRRMRRAMEGINTSILRLVAAVSSDDRVAELDLGEHVDREGERTPDAPTIEETIAMLETAEQESFWARFV